MGRWSLQSLRHGGDDNDDAVGSCRGVEVDKAWERVAVRTRLAGRLGCPTQWYGHGGEGEQSGNDKQWLQVHYQLYCSVTAALGTAPARLLFHSRFRWAFFCNFYNTCWQHQI